MALQIANSHPRVELQSEFGCFMFVDHPYSHYSHSLLRQWWHKRNARFTNGVSWFHRLPSGNFLGNLSFTLRLLAAIRRHSGQGQVDSSIVYSGLRDLSSDAIVVGDKYPDYVYQIEELSSSPQVRIVCLVRDPRAGYYSYRRAFHNWGGGRWSKQLLDAGHYAWNWSQLMRRIESVSERTNVLVVRYEDLVADPGGYVARLADLTGVDAKGFDYSFVHTSSIRKFAGQIDPKAEKTILNVAGDRMRELRYS